MSSNINFGIATPKVEILSDLPNVRDHQEIFNFDVTAFNWLAFQNSPFLRPLQTEQIEDRYRNWGACFPSRRQYYISNYMVDKDGNSSETIPEDKPFITWKPVSPTGIITPGVLVTRIANRFDSYRTSVVDTRLPAGQTPIQFKEIPGDDYIGPEWNNQSFKAQPIPKDQDIYEELLEGSLKLQEQLKVENVVSETIQPDTVNAINQAKVADGLWWGVESSDFLEEDMPFWVTIKMPEAPPAPNSFETLFIISLGVDSNDNTDRYDIVLTYNKKPQIIDYNDVEIGNPDSRPSIVEFESIASKIKTSEGLIEVGIMTVGGRLVVSVNGEEIIYTRVLKSGSNENKGTIKAAKIKKGKIRVYGTNVQATLLAYPMTFAPLSILSFPLPDKKEIDTDDGTQVIPISYSGADWQGEPTGLPVCVLPVPPPRKLNNYGVDCEVFEDDNGSVTLDESFGLHREGLAQFKKINLSEEDIGLDNLPKSNFFILIMEPQNREEWLGKYTIPYSKTPYFFKLKGVDTAFRNTPVIVSTDVTSRLISVTENAATSDYFHVKKTATVTLYNEYGIFNSLRDKQRGVRISWGWNENTKRTFTGVIVGNSTNEIAGKETITIQCEDYMHILKANPIINSPFYDGMVAWYAIRDLARRGGLTSFFRGWESHLDYFLPSGYSFSKPRIRFKSTETIFNAMIDLVKRFQAYIYFDGDGGFHIDKLPGGLFSEPVPPYTHFTTNPEDTGRILILEEKNIDYDFSSTINHISIVTLDRDTRQPIVYARAASGSSDRLAFKKKALKDEAAYGDINVAKAVANEWATRVFKPIRKTSFKTIGDSSVLDPLTYITVDGVVYRLTSVKRSFSAESNDFVQNYEAEWLGG